MMKKKSDQFWDGGPQRGVEIVSSFFSSSLGFSTSLGLSLVASMAASAPFFVASFSAALTSFSTFLTSFCSALYKHQNTLVMKTANETILLNICRWPTFKDVIRSITFRGVEVTEGEWQLTWRHEYQLDKYNDHVPDNNNGVGLNMVELLSGVVLVIK